VLSASAPPVLKIFISYSRRDLQIANNFVDELKAKNFEVFIDKRGLQYGEQWQNQLAESIRSSDTVVWLISEASVASRWVKWELGEVERLKKRLVPVRIANVDPDALPESLGKIHALPSDEVFDFSRHFDLLVDALKTDAAWLREATRLLDRAGQWKAKDQDEAQLLGGRALSDAEGWVSTKPAAAPAINSEILDLLLHSRQGVSRRQKRTVLLALVVAALGIGLAVYAFWERNSALASQSTYLSKLSAESVTNGDAVTGALLAMSALPRWPYAIDRPLVPEAERSLHDAMFSVRELHVLEGHTADVNTAVFSADDRLILTASDDGKARLWRADTGELVRTVGKHSGKALSAIFAASDRLILTVDESATIWLWNANDGSLHHRLAGHSDPVKSVAATPGGDRVVSASSDWTARVWRPNSPGEPPIVLRGHNGPVNTAVFSPDGKQVLTSSEDGSAIVWKLETGQAVRQLVGHHDSVLRAVFNQAGSRIATISEDRTARVWEASTGKEMARLEHPRPVSSVEFCPSGDCIVTTGYDGVARVWDIKTGDVKFQLNGHSEQITKVVVDPAGRNSAVTVGRDGAIFVWDLETGARVLTLNVHAADVFDAAFSSTGEFLVTTSRDRTARVWRVPAAAATLSRTNVGTDTRTIDVDGKAKLIVLGSYDGTVALVDTSTSRRLASVGISKGAVTLARFSEQASQVLLGSEDGSVALYSIPKLERLYFGMTDNSEIAGGYFTNTGFSVLTVGGGTYGYDGTTLSKIRHHDYDSAFTIVPAGDDRALVAGAKGATRIIDNVSGRTTVRLEGHGGTVLHAAFGPGGRIVATASEDGTGIIWNALTGDKLHDLTGYQLSPSFVALSEDGGYVAIASQDGTVRIWKMGASTPSAVYRGHLAAVRAVRFLPSGGMVSVSKDGEVHFWHFGDDYSRAAATTKAILPRCFTSKQLAAFGLRKELPDLCRPKPQTANRNE
jgi:WD40 repeat protein